MVIVMVDVMEKGERRTDDLLSAPSHPCVRVSTHSHCPQPSTINHQPSTINHQHQPSSAVTRGATALGGTRYRSSELHREMLAITGGAIETERVAATRYDHASDNAVFVDDWNARWSQARFHFLPGPRSRRSGARFEWGLRGVNGT